MRTSRKFIFRIVLLLVIAFGMTGVYAASPPLALASPNQQHPDLHEEPLYCEPGWMPLNGHCVRTRLPDPPERHPGAVDKIITGLGAFFIVVTPFM